MSNALTPIKTARVFLAQMSIYSLRCDEVTYLNIAKPSSNRNATMPNTHANVTNFLVDVEVLKRLDRFAMKVTTLIIAVTIPIICMQILNDYDQAGGKNRGGHTRFPGEFVYLCSHTNLIASVTKTSTRVIAVSMIEKWQNILSEAHPLKPLTALITMIAIAVRISSMRTPKNKYLGNPFEHLIAINDSKLMAVSPQAMQLVILGMLKSQALTPSLFRAQYAIIS